MTWEVAGNGALAPAGGLCQRLDLNGQVHFVGNLPQDELKREWRRSQAFVFPSLREFGGAVGVEAMACGLPAIVVNYGGPGEHATPETGIALEMGPRQQIITALREAMERLVRDHDLCRRFYEAGVRRVRDEYTWTQKAARIAGFYREALEYSSKEINT